MHAAEDVTQIVRLLCFSRVCQSPLQQQGVAGSTNSILLMRKRLQSDNFELFRKYAPISAGFSGK